MGTDSCVLAYVYPISALPADPMTFSRGFAMTRMATFHCQFLESTVLFDRGNRLRNFGVERYDPSLWIWIIILLFWYHIFALG